MEAAVVTPVFIFIVLATMELLFMLHGYLKVTGATGQAIRAVTVSGSDPDTDYVAMQSLLHGLAGFDPSAIRQIVVYEASGAGSEVPFGCRSVPIPSGLPCNGYVGEDLYLPYIDSGGTLTGNWGCGLGARDENWCPTGRESSISAPGGPDHVGVYVKVELPSLTGILGSSRTIGVNRVARIEPMSN
ncbi:MAG: TadE family protein [Actinomycetota bacterium]